MERLFLGLKRVVHTNLRLRDRSSRRLLPRPLRLLPPLPRRRRPRRRHRRRRVPARGGQWWRH